MREQKKFDQLEDPIKLTVKTRCAEKYLLVDRETGQVFVGNNQGHWDRIDTVTRDS
jgi:hypothetical protein